MRPIFSYTLFEAISDELPVGTRVYDYGCRENNRNPVDEKTGKTLVLDQNGKPLNLD